MSTVVVPARHHPHPTRESWELVTGSHLAISTQRSSPASPVPIRSGRFELDPVTGVGTLELALADGGCLRGVATRGERDVHGAGTWTVVGDLQRGAQRDRALLTLADHGVHRSSVRWWWLSGVGQLPERGRRPIRHGSSLVADLLFTV